MTRTEFIQTATISMANKVIDIYGATDTADWKNVVTSAEELADELEERGYDFDEED